MSSVEEELKNSESAMKLASQLGLKPEIDGKLKYYKAQLQASANLMTAIDGMISKYGDDYTDLAPEEVYRISKLMIEKLDAQLRFETQKNFVDMWYQKATEYDAKMGAITEECNDKFEATVAKAREVAKLNLRLQGAMANYDKSENEDQLVKNEYWLYLTKEIQNREQFLKESEEKSNSNLKIV